MENPIPEDTIPRGKWQASRVPPGSIQDRGMWGKKRTDDRPEEGGTLNSGDPENKPWQEQSEAADGRDQRKEGADVDFRESDLPIVVRDGNAVHKAKGRARGQREQSTHHGTRILPTNGVKLPACNGDWPWHIVPDARTDCASPEEPGAVIPHAGICEGGAGQPASLPQCAKNQRNRNCSPDRRVRVSR
jgi:hypothetical protein